MITHSRKKSQEQFTNLQRKEIMLIMWMVKQMISRTYPESDWQLFKQALNVWFDFADYRELPFRFSRSMVAQNLAAMIGEGTIKSLEDLKIFSKQLQYDVRCLIGDEAVLEEFHGIKNGGEDEEA